MKIATIVNSNSHTAYLARVVDEMDAVETPNQASYAFGRAVSIETPDGETIGLICDSKLINPEYANFGPRLSLRPELANFSPDFISEQGILISILPVGTIGTDGSVSHSLPKNVLHAGSPVNDVDREKMLAFHQGKNGVELHYYAHLMANAGSLAEPLLEAVIEELSAASAENDKKRLALLLQNLKWQKAMAAAKFI